MFRYNAFRNIIILKVNQKYSLNKLTYLIFLKGHNKFYNKLVIDA